MKRYLILAQSQATAKAMQNTLCALQLDYISESEKSGRLPFVVIAGGGTAGVERFDHLADRIADELGGGGHGVPVGRAHILVDTLDLSRANPLQQQGWDATIAMLILAFPEVRWEFAVLRTGAVGSPSLHRWHSALESVFGPDVDPLFDGSGLRDCIRRMIANTTERADGTPEVRRTRFGRFWAAVRNIFAKGTVELAGGEETGVYEPAPYVPTRLHLAVAMDDETSYAYFNAYAAYRFGFRAFPLSRDAAARAILRGPRGEPCADCVPRLTFEDIYLSYPDKPSHTHYSDLGSEATGSRRKAFPLLERAHYRIFVSTDHRHTHDDDKHKRNIRYIDSEVCTTPWGKESGYGDLVSKPYAGLFALWQKATSRRRPPGASWFRRFWNRLVSLIVWRPWLAPGFVWPSPPKRSGIGGDTGHSAPGRLLQTATHMIERCEALLRIGGLTAADAVRCAVLATDALELLGDRTPTTSMEALKLKHMGEVTAECQFSGIEYHIEIKPRLKEIQAEALSLSRWFNRRLKAMAAMNAEMTTVIELMRIFREHGQFDEALVCQNRVRHLHNRLWVCQKPMPRIVCLPILKYLEIILASFRWFLAAIFGWMLAFVALLGLARNVRPPATHATAVGPWEQAFGAFTGASSFTSVDFVWNLITATAVLVGIAHVGIFISHVYMLVSRKD